MIAEPAASGSPDRGFLWRISKDGRSSHLYGTVHIGKSEWATPGSATVRALRDSDLLALELDLLDTKIVERLLQRMKPRPDRTLDAKVAQRLLAQVKAACLSDEMLGLMSPEWVAMSLTVLAARHDGLDPAFAVDRAMSLLARRWGKPVISLETVDQQADALESPTGHEARRRVETIVKALEDGQVAPLLRRIALVWADGQHAELERYDEWCQCVETEGERQLMKRLLDERNGPMAERIDSLHQGGKKVFVAVGSLHLFGPHGLPALLAQRGYEVQRIAFR
jgi:uncharacterized protein